MAGIIFPAISLMSNLDFNGMPKLKDLKFEAAATKIKVSSSSLSNVINGSLPDFNRFELTHWTCTKNRCFPKWSTLLYLQSILNYSVPALITAVMPLDIQSYLMEWAFPSLPQSFNAQ